MTSIFIRCRQCKNNVYVDRPKLALPPTFQLSCPYCGYLDGYSNLEAIEERWEFACPTCSGRFFTRKSPPMRVRCPHCTSLLHIAGDGAVSVLMSGSPPTGPPVPSLAGATIGSLVGAIVAGPIGALLGLIAGGALGAAANVPEAMEV